MFLFRGDRPRRFSGRFCKFFDFVASRFIGSMVLIRCFGRYGNRGNKMCRSGKKETPGQASPGVPQSRKTCRSAVVSDIRRTGDLSEPRAATADVPWRFRPAPRRALRFRLLSSQNDEGASLPRRLAGAFYQWQTTTSPDWMMLKRSAAEPTGRFTQPWLPRPCWYSVPPNAACQSASCRPMTLPTKGIQ